MDIINLSDELIRTTSKIVHILQQEDSTDESKSRPLDFRLISFEAHEGKTKIKCNKVNFQIA